VLSVPGTVPAADKQRQELMQSFAAAWSLATTTAGSDGCRALYLACSRGRVDRCL
jgi:hypothetical protein